MSMAKNSLLMVAGESSGDFYGGALCRALRGRDPSLEIFGCAGEAMREAGVETVVDAREVSAIGITEVVTGLPRAWRALARLTREAMLRRPRGAVLIDFPDFNLRLAARLRRLGIPVIYFVSPQIWAWRRGRLKQLRATVQKMLCIFDFEQEIYRKAGIPVEFVGHPLVDVATVNSSRENFLKSLGFDDEVPTVALLPGSRRSEMSHHLPVMLAAASQIATRRSVQFVISLAQAAETARVELLVQQHYQGRGRLRVVAGRSQEALEHAAVAAVASGTATLEAALHERPMVVIYRVSPATAWVARRLVKVPFYSMVNLLANRRVVPELIQADLTAEKLAKEIEFLLDHAEACARMVEGLREVRARLGPSGAIERAASAVWHELGLGGASLSAA